MLGVFALSTELHACSELMGDAGGCLDRPLVSLVEGCGRSIGPEAHAKEPGLRGLAFGLTPAMLRQPAGVDRHRSIAITTIDDPAI
jgi:hypothetical protein